MENLRSICVSKTRKPFFPPTVRVAVAWLTLLMGNNFNDFMRHFDVFIKFGIILEIMSVADLSSEKEADGMGCFGFDG